MIAANAKNIAVNSPVQGSAADLIKIAMARVENELNQTSSNAKMLLQVHDELVFECPKSDIDKVKALIKDAMESAMDLGVPLKVDIRHGHTWLEAH
jgi:DNA polymerase-1